MQIQKSIISYFPGMTCIFIGRLVGRYLSVWVSNASGGSDPGADSKIYYIIFIRYDVYIY